LQENDLAFALAGQFGPQLLLRIDAAPIRSDDSPSVVRNPFRLTDEVTVEALEFVRGWAPLTWRYDRTNKVISSGLRGPMPWPIGDRFALPQIFLRGRIGGNKTVMLQICAAPQEQTMEQVVNMIEDVKEVIYHADNFNKLMMKKGSEHDFEAPKVRVCAPVGCRVMDSRIPQLAKKGAVVTLMEYPSDEVEKFVYDGAEQFLELPQAFFHHTAWATGLSSMLFDLQGAQTESGDIHLVDPGVLRAPKVGVSELLNAAAGIEQDNHDHPNDDSFEVLHGKCGQLCRRFDPNRRGCRVRRMCGMPACGLGGGGGASNSGNPGGR